MTLPRSSRRVVVDTIPYRFMVTKRDDDHVNLTVEREEHPGRCLVAMVDERRCYAIGTTEVTAFVRRGVSAGWVPVASPPGPFHLGTEMIDEALTSVGR